MTAYRLARAVVAMAHAMSDAIEEEGALPYRDDEVETVRAAIEADAPHVMKMVRVVQVVAAAYLGGDTEALGRELINRVAADGKTKVFNMNVVDGKHIGPWMMVIRPDHRPQQPAILRPDAPVTTLILPGKRG